MPRKVNTVLIVGFGSIGRKHLQILKRVRPALRAVILRSGLNPEISEAEIGARVVYDFPAAMRLGLDAAIVASPANTHITYLRDILRAGIPVFVEKPLSSSLEEIDAFLEVEEALSKTPVHVGYVLRHDPTAQKMYELIRDRRIGDIVHARVEAGSFLPNWRKTNDFRNSVSARKDLGGGVLLELSHEIDYISWFFGKIRAVCAISPGKKVFDLDVEEMVEALIQTDRASISMNINFNTARTLREVRVFGSQGTIQWDAMKKEISIFGNDGSVENFQWENLDMNQIFEVQARHFLESAETSFPPKVGLEEGVQAVRVVDALRRSIDERRWVEVS
jgi:predicted dehydrogenase